jgi:hypothetical protein
VDTGSREGRLDFSNALFSRSWLIRQACHRSSRIVTKGDGLPNRTGRSAPAVLKPRSVFQDISTAAIVEVSACGPHRIVGRRFPAIN